MAKKKVLMVSFFYPPLGGAAIQRSYKFAQYLPNFGYEPIILTVKDYKNYLYDKSFSNSNCEKVFRSSFWGMSKVLNLLDKMQLGTMKNFLSRQVFMPDDKIEWFLPAFVKAVAIIRQGCDVIWTTSPPETAHLIGLALKYVYNIPWVVDFRNEWSTNPAYYFPTELSRYVNFLLEDAIITKADAVCTLSPAHTKLLQERYSGRKSNFYTIENGFDSSDIHSNENTPSCSKFTITYTGSFYGVQMPNSFLSALNSLADTYKLKKDEVKIRFIGNLWDANEMVKSCKFHIEVVDFVPHSEVYKYLYQTDVLLITLTDSGERSLPGKIYEYMAIGKPILAVVPLESEVAKLINRSKIGFVASTTNVNEIQSTIMAMYDMWKNRTIYIKSDLEEIKKYERINLTKQLASIFDEVVACHQS